LILAKSNNYLAIQEANSITDYNPHSILEEFVNEPVTNFSEEKGIQNIIDALATFEDHRAQGKIEAKPSIIADDLKRKIYSRYDPANQAILLGNTTFAETFDVSKAINVLQTNSNNWSLKSFEERATLLDRVTVALREARAELTAYLIREAGKPWIDADAEVAEAIDFCRYYARLARSMALPHQNSLPGEYNTTKYIARGITVVIAPWNFPLAILAGMALGALVTGNCVVLKPAEQGSLIGYRFYQLLLLAGIPENVIAFLPGEGELIGRALVDHPLVATIIFTGSREVGLDIITRANKINLGQRAIKRVITELGGKNSIIIDSDADLDEAISGVIKATFGCAGQKCSACSRLIIVGDKFKKCIERLKDALKNIIIGPTEDSATFMGPLIDQEAVLRLKSKLQNIKDTNLIYQGIVPEGGSFFPPTIYDQVAKASDLWNEELFGPILAVVNVNDFEEAIRLASDSDYALTGSVYSRNPRNIEYAKVYFEVGNLYINRPCTGAIVGRHPFGGYKLSGTGAKAGGTDYLIQFCNTKTVSENTVRKGFTPEL
jgi:RHH-type transcriptional regulator, proline utilization regulon repressor / proline dehydrogenase / delta 1-pyrroline-5-carboxylate dehydrogenase